MHQYWASVYMGVGGVGWVVAKSKTKKQDNANGRAYSGYDVHMYPQWVSNPLQGLDRHILTVEAIHCQIRARYWHHFTSCEFTWSVKSIVEKQTC